MSNVRAKSRMRRGIEGLLAVLLLPVDVVRVTWLWLRLSIRFASRTYLYLLSGLTHVQRPQMEVLLCRPSPSPFVWDEKVRFVAARPLTLRLFRWICGGPQVRWESLASTEEKPRTVRLVSRNYLRLVLVLGMTWGLLGTVAVGQGRRMQARRHGRDIAAEYLAQADKLFNEGQYGRARIQFLNAMQQRPGDVGAHWGVARCALELNRAREARQSLERVLSLEPSHQMARASLIDLLRRQGQVGQALEHAMQAVRLDPADAGALVRLGECYRLQGRSTLARRKAEEALRLAPTHGRALLLAAASSADLGDCEAADRLLASKLESVPAALLDRLAIAQVQIQCGRLGAAREQLEAILSRERTHVPAARELAELRLAMGDVDGAIGIYRDLAPAESEESTIRIRLAELLLGDGRLDEAHEVGRALVREVPQSAAGPLVLGTVYYLRELWSASIEQCQAALKQDPRSVAARTLLARALMRQGQHQEAIPWLTGLTSGDWRNLETLLMLAECHVELKNRKEAFALLERAMAMYPSSEAPHLLAARLHMSRNERNKAVAAYERALELNPAHPLALNNLASLLSSQELGDRHDLPEAYRLASQAWNLHPGSPEIADTLGWIHVLRGEPEAAYTLLSYAARQLRHDPLIRVHLAVALDGLGQIDEAWAQLELARELSPSLASDRQFRALRDRLKKRGASGSAP